MGDQDIHEYCTVSVELRYGMSAPQLLIGA